MIGTRLGPYEIVELIGQGGMATVYRAYQPNVGRFVAVKVIHRAILGDTRLLERFQREAHLIARLEHPHLLPVYDYDGAHDPPYIVMRYLESGTLKDVLDQGTLPLGEIAYSLRQIGSALDFAHRQGVIHRDIKPSNIMIDQDGNAFLTDFGIARLAEGSEGLTQTGLAVGTPGYMAPEQGMGLEVDQRVDIYSLGIMLFQMLTGRLPYNAESPMSLILKHMNEPIPSAMAFNDALPEEIDEVIRRAIAKRPEDRYESATDFADEVTRAIGKSSGSVRPIMLRRAAQNRIAAVHKARESHQTEIDALIARFESERSAVPYQTPTPRLATAATTRPAVTTSAPTPTPLMSRSAAIPLPSPQRRGGVSPVVIASVIVVLLAVAVVALLLMRTGVIGGPGAAGQATPTERPVVILVTEATAGATVETSAATALVVLPVEVTATETSAAATVEVIEPTSVPTDTEAPTDTAAPTLTDSPEPPTAVALAPSETVTRRPTSAPLPSETPVPTDTPVVPTTEAPATTLIVIAPTTVEPSLTETEAPTATATATPSPTEVVVEPSDTSSPTEVALLPSDTSEATSMVVVIVPTDTAQPTSTPTASATPSPMPSDTPTATDTLIPSDTPTDVPTATLTPTATATLTPSDTPTPTDTLTPSDTPVPAARTTRSLVLRSGPGSQYPRMASLDADQTLTITGISEDGAWYQVSLPDGSTAWLSSSPALVDTLGDLRGVPIAEAPTETPTDTPSHTPTLTPTPTATSTPTPLPTNTPTETLVPTDTPAPTDTPTPTEIPTETLQPTWTPSEPPTLEAGTLEAPMVTATPVEIVNLPPGLGHFPYVADFEAQEPLKDWQYDVNGWQVIDEGGEHFLVGQAELQQPMVILGTESPDWIDTPDLAISYRFSIDPKAPGARMIFRQSDTGYNVIEVTPKAITLKRNAETPDLGAPQNERTLQTQRAQIGTNKWHHIVVWADGVNLFVYLDGLLVVTVEDLLPPALPAGRILLQSESAAAPVRFDDIIVQKAEALSTHFEAPDLPSAWKTTDPRQSTLEHENTGNQYLQLKDEVTVTPDMRPINDLNLSYRVYIRQAGYQIHVRQSVQGSVLLDMVGGIMTVSQLDHSGNVVQTWPKIQFYNRNRWEQVGIQFIGNRLQISRDGVLKFDELLQSAPPAGGVDFKTRANDIIFLDDVLITEAATSSNETARVAYAAKAKVDAQLFRELRSDLTENFDSPLRTQVWWQDGRKAPGTFETDTSSQDHQKFLRMTSTDSTVARLFTDELGVEIFRSGQDTVNFTNSTDVLLTIDVRFPEGATGVAWAGARTAPAYSNKPVDGYRLELHRAADGTLTVVARFAGDLGEVYYEGPVPELAEGDPTPWINLKILTLRDHVYFFVNDRYLADGDGTLALGGSIALGVDPNTTADFDTLVIRDSSPHDAS